MIVKFFLINPPDSLGNKKEIECVHAIISDTYPRVGEIVLLDEYDGFTIYGVQVMFKVHHIRHDYVNNEIHIFLE